MNIPLPCAKCGGKLFREADTYTCINCGHEQPPISEPKPLAEIDWTQIKNQWSVKRAE